MVAFKTPNERYDWLCRAFASEKRAKDLWEALLGLYETDVASNGAPVRVAALVRFDPTLREKILELGRKVGAERMENSGTERATALVGARFMQIAALIFGFRLMMRGPQQRDAMLNELCRGLAAGYLARAFEEPFVNDERHVDGLLFAKAALARVHRIVIAVSAFRMLPEIDALTARHGGDEEEALKEYLGVGRQDVVEAAFKAWGNTPIAMLEERDTIAHVAIDCMDALVRARGDLADPRVVAATRAAEGGMTAETLLETLARAQGEFSRVIAYLEIPNIMAGEIRPVAAFAASVTYPIVPSRECYATGMPENAAHCVAAVVRELTRKGARYKSADAIPIVLEALTRGMGYRRAYCFFVSREGGHYICRYAAGPGAKASVDHARVMIGHGGPFYGPLEAGELYDANDDVPMWASSLSTGCASVMVIPLLARGQCVGFFVGERPVPDRLLTEVERRGLRELGRAFTHALTGASSASATAAA